MNMKKNPFSLHVNVDDFLPATDEEKAYMVQMRPSSTFFKDGVKRLVKNKVALISFIVIILITLTSIFLPMFWPYGYSQQLGMTPGKPMDPSYNDLAPFEYSRTEQKLIDSGEKVFVSLDGIEDTVARMLDAIHDGLYQKAKKNLEDNTYPCQSLEEVKEKMAARGGFAKTMWCGDEACEIRMKEEAGVTSRCIPFQQEHLGDVCPICGKPAKHMVVWGVAY